MNFPFGLCYNALLRYLYLETTPCAPSHGYISSFLGFAVVSSPLTNDPFGLCLPSLRVLLVFLQTSKSKICKYPLPPLLHVCRPDPLFSELLPRFARPFTSHVRTFTPPLLYSFLEVLETG